MVDTPTLWKGLTQVNTSDTGLPPSGAANQIDGQVAALGAGYAVVWTDLSRVHNSGGNAIVAQRYDSLGEKSGGEIKVSTFNSGDQSQPAVGLLSNGNIAVAYTDNFEGDFDVYVRLIGPSGSAGRLDVIDTGSARTLDPAVTGFADGSYLVTYVIGSGDDTDIVGRMVSATGAVGAQFDIDNQSDNRFAPKAATLTNGNAVVVYGDEAGGNSNDTDIRFGIVAPNGTLPVIGKLIPGADGFGLETEPDVAALKGGGFVIAWTDPDSTVNDIRAAIFDNAGTLVRGNILINTTTTNDQNEPSVVALADGGFVVTWEDETGNLARGQRFTSGGDKVGGEFTVKNGLGNFNPESALLADGRLAYTLGDLSTGDDDVVTTIFDPRTSPINGTDASETITSRRDGAEVNGLGGNDTLFGFEGADRLDGGLGADTMLGGLGNDAYVVDNSGDVADETGGGGVDSVFASVSFVLGLGADNLILTGVAAIDGTGNILANAITGNTAKNVLRGEGGADQFQFIAALNKKTNVDTIGDFSPTDDTIALDVSIFKKLKKVGPLKGNYFEKGKKADDKNDFITYDKKTGACWYDKNGDKQGGAIKFAVLDGGPNDVTKADFVVI